MKDGLQTVIRMMAALVYLDRLVARVDASRAQRGEVSIR
jgi:hypothetical protein